MSQELKQKLEKEREDSDLSRVLSTLQSGNISYTVTMASPESDRVIKYGPHVYMITAGQLVWEFVPSGCIERFSTID